jgi:uncharacterized membrane protein SirB2
MNYPDLKLIHVALAALSIGLFVLRGCWRMADSPRLRRPWVRRLPHLVDTLLLASGVGLAYWSGQSPLAQPWLGAKIAALAAYIALGSIAIKYGRTPYQRNSAFAGALACVGYIVLTARTKNPLYLL